MASDGIDTNAIFDSLGFSPWYIIALIWFVFFVIQLFLAFGTAYRCTKRGNDNGVGLFIYLIGYFFAALIQGLGLYYYIRYLPPKQVIVQQQVHLTPEQIQQIQQQQMQQRIQQATQQAQQEHDCQLK